MDLILFLKGMFVGFLIAAPVGPVGILCAHRTVETGLVSGLSSGLGAAVADTVFGGVAAFGLAFVADFLVTNEVVLRLVGALLLFAIGVRTLIKVVKTKPDPVPRHRIASDFASTFALTITNPITILSFGPVFIAAGAVVQDGQLYGAWSLILGVLIGSAIWWLTLCAGVSIFRKRITDEGMRWINKVSGSVIIFFGILVLLSLTKGGQQLIGSPQFTL